VTDLKNVDFHILNMQMTVMSSSKICVGSVLSACPQSANEGHDLSAINRDTFPGLACETGEVFPDDAREDSLTPDEMMVGGREGRELATPGLANDGESTIIEKARAASPGGAVRGAAGGGKDGESTIIDGDAGDIVAGLTDVDVQRATTV